MTGPPPPDRIHFFLGGQDLEMVTIRDLLEQTAAAAYCDKRLRWGAAASAYRHEIDRCLTEGRTPVLVELTDDVGLDPARVIVVDHHGLLSGAGAPSSLEQVFRLLALPEERWTRWFDLVAANDIGYIPALQELGATADEITRIRAADRAAQGITPEEEVQGEHAAAARQVLAGGRLTIVDLGHCCTAAAVDRLHPALGGPGYENLLVRCPEEVNFFGAGELVRALDARFPGGWYGGALPERGFWGHSGRLPEALPMLVGLLQRAA